jgi:hypothetical protein
MPLFEIGIATIGLALLSLSLVLCWRRTHDQQFFYRWWLPRAMLTRLEYVLNRIGFVLALVAAIRIWVDVVALFFYLH